MKKKIKSILTMVLALCLTLGLTPGVMTQASDLTKTSITKEYLPDGSYFETEIIQTSTLLRSSTKSASKTTTYKNDKGESLWYAKVSANFTYTGSTSSCTSATASAGSYNKVWKIISKSASKSGHTGTAKVSAKCYLGFLPVGTINQTVNISCDKNGNIS